MPIDIPLENLIVNSNRGPDVFNTEDDLRRDNPYPGGLTTALAPVLSEGGIWISTAETPFERRHFRARKVESIPFNGGHIRLTEVTPLVRDYISFKKEFCDGLWWAMHETKSFHNMRHTAYPQPIIPSEHFDSYQEVNRLHALRAARIAGAKLNEAGGSKVILNPQDFHLMTYSEKARNYLSDRIQRDVLMFHFLHTPIPPIRTIEEILDEGHADRETLKSLFSGLQWNDLVLTQTAEFQENLAGIFDFFGFQVTAEGPYHRVENQGHSFYIGNNPIGINVKRVMAAANSDPNALNSICFDDRGREIGLYDLINKYRADGYIIGGSIERLDPTKGLLPRLGVLDQVIDNAYRKGQKFIYIGFWPGSRGNLKNAATEKVDEINKKARERYGHDVIFYKFEPINSPKNVALMKQLDFYTATPLDDGRNLTADEYVASQLDKDVPGVLLIGNCGTQREYRIHGIEPEHGAYHLDINDQNQSRIAFLAAFDTLSNGKFHRIGPKLNAFIFGHDVKDFWMPRNIEYLGEVTKPIQLI